MEKVNPLKQIGVAIVLIALSVAGAIIGVQLITTTGVTPNTSIIGALFAMLLARIPLQAFRRYRSVEIQNLAQTAISSATFGAANSLLMPIAVPWALGQPQLVLTMFCGVSAAMLLDAYLLYRLFDTRMFPASNAWPPGQPLPTWATMALSCAASAHVQRASVWSLTQTVRLRPSPAR